MIRTALAVALASLFATAAWAVEVEGLPIKVGETVEQVQKALDTTMQPEPVTFGIPTPVQKTQLHLKTKGIWVFFERDEATTIRVDAPFAGNVGGVKIGDPAEKLTQTFGKPVKQAKFGLNDSYTYYFDDVTTTRFDVNPSGEIETIFFIK